MSDAGTGERVAWSAVGVCIPVDENEGLPSRDAVDKNFNDGVERGDKERTEEGETLKGVPVRSTVFDEVGDGDGPRESELTSREEGVENWSKL